MTTANTKAKCQHRWTHRNEVGNIVCGDCGSAKTPESKTARREWSLIVRGNANNEATWHWEVLGPNPTAYHDDITVRDVTDYGPTANTETCPHPHKVLKAGEMLCPRCGEVFPLSSNTATGLLEMEDAYAKYIKNTNPADASPYRCFKAAWHARDEEVRRLREALEKARKYIELDSYKEDEDGKCAKVALAWIDNHVSLKDAGGNE